MGCGCLAAAGLGIGALGVVCSEAAEPATSHNGALAAEMACGSS